jgi:hypothetical protein
MCGVGQMLLENHNQQDLHSNAIKLNGKKKGQM